MCKLSLNYCDKTTPYKQELTTRMIVQNTIYIINDIEEALKQDKRISIL